MRHLPLCALALVSLPSLATAQTVREQVVGAGVSEEIVVADYPPLSLAAMTSAAGAVLHVTIRSGDTFLSRDGMAIETDYRATVIDVVKEVNGVAAGDVITVRRTGGTLSLEGRSVVSSEQDFPAFVAGGGYVLFLKTDGGQPFEMLAGPQSAFRVHEGGVAAMGPSTRTPATVLLPLFLHEVRGLAARAPQAPTRAER